MGRYRWQVLLRLCAGAAMKSIDLMRRFSAPAVVPDVGDPHWANVTLMAHLTGEQGSTALVDSSSAGRTITSNGAYIDTSRTVGGLSSGLRCSSGFATVSPIALGGGDFTIEFYLYVNTLPGSQVGLLGNTSDGGYWFIGLGLSGNLFASTNAGTLASTSGVATAESTFHVAVVRKGYVLQLYLNGSVALGSSGVWDVSTGGAAIPIRIGSYDGSVTRADVWINELRITSGVARYNGSFTPPTTPFPNHA